MKLTIQGRPPALNDRTGIGKQGHGYTTKAAKDYQKDVALQARTQYQGPPLEGQLAVLYVVGIANGRRDWDASYKDIQDALSGIAWGDDRQIVVGIGIINNRAEADAVSVFVEPLAGLDKLLNIASAAGGAIRKAT